MLVTLKRRHELHVGALADEIRISLKTVSRNLRLLERAGLVVSEPRGGYVFYRIGDEIPLLARKVLTALTSGGNG